jgi:hypothetical protein
MINEIEKYYNKYNFPSVEKLYKLMKSDEIDIKKDDIKNFINKQSEAQIHRKKNPKKLTPIAVLNPNSMFQIDIFDLSKYYKTNSGYKYIFACIDIFSRSAYCVGMKTKNINDTYEAFNTILKRYKLHPKSITSDSDNSFLGSKFQNLLKENNIIHNTVVINDHHSLGIIDRFARTIKTIFSKLFIRNHNTKWHEKLYKIVDQYNDTPNAGIENIAPSKAEDFNNKIQIQNLNIDKINNSNIKHNISIGDLVRKIITKQFTKKSSGKWSDKIYNVIDVNNNRITLDNHKEYKPENLLKVELPTINKINPVVHVNKINKIDKTLKAVGISASNIIKKKRSNL